MTQSRVADTLQRKGVIVMVVVRYLIIGMLFGTAAAAISLFLGSSVLLALIVYSGVGSFSILMWAVFLYTWSRAAEGKTKKYNANEPR